MSKRVERGVNLRRRQIVTSLGLASTVGGFGIVATQAQATELIVNREKELRGTEFDLEITQSPVNITGVTTMATVVNGMLPGPTLHWREGDTVTLRVTNRLPHSTSIHWHGILVPAEMDGVPGLSFEGIAPGKTFVYRFQVKQSGTYWYHSHSRFQEQTGLFGAIVIEPRQGERVTSGREHVVMLSDWTDDEPERLFAKLKKSSDFFNFAQPTFGNFTEDVAKIGLNAALEKRQMWNRMRMVPTDFSDVTSAPSADVSFSYLVNGKRSSENWTALFNPGEKIRLRFINGSATTIFDVRIPGLKLMIISADGQDVQPVLVDEFRISVAETYDVLVEPSGDRAYTIFAQSIGRTGFGRATLAPRSGMVGEITAMDKPQWLTMTDMMGAMGASGAMPGMPGMTNTSGGSTMPAMDMSSMQGMDHSKMPGMHKSATSQTTGSNNSGAEAAMPMSMGNMDRAQMQGMKPSSKPHGEMTGTPASAAEQARPPNVRHARTEYGPNVDMHVDMPRTNLDDPGVNLRENGRRVLTYADLHTIGGSIDQRRPTREIELHLTGHMSRFVWSFDGQKFSESLPIHFRFGERLRIILVNDTMMNHPIHLHGMWGELETPEGQFQVRKHTINVQPAQRVAYLVTADAIGRWAFHCHLLYHMEAGMFREVVVS